MMKRLWNNLIKKLQGKKGASMMLALVFLLMTISISGIMIFSAFSNAARHTTSAQNHKDIVLLESAALMVRDMFLDDNSYIELSTIRLEQRTKVNNVWGDPAFIEERSQNTCYGELSLLIEKLLMGSVGNVGSGGSVVETIKLQYDKSAMPDITSSYVMDENYNISITFTLNKASIILRLDSSSSRSFAYETVYDNGDEANSYICDIISTDLLTIRWDGALISQVGGAL